jgi:hypothetical protein
VPELNLSSPAAGFARQAAMDVRIEAALLSSMRRFLDDVFALAVEQQTALGAANVAERWSHYTSVDWLSQRLPAAVAEYVSAGMAESSLPTEAYTSTMAVFQRASEQAWSTTDTVEALRAALSPDGGETFLVPLTASAMLTAAAPVVKRDAEGKPIYRATAGLDQGGMNWADRMKRDARTAATGLDGTITLAAMRTQGVETKRWVTRRDERVRPAHAGADGQTVPVSEPFIVGGYSMMHPGDRNAPIDLTVNCRCIMISGTLDKDGNEIDTLEAQATGFADDVYAQAKAAEPEITAEMKRLAQATGTRLEGLEYRLKDQSSLARKIAADARADGLNLADAATKVSDSVRYTVIAGEGNYARAGQSVIDSLRAQGWTARVKNAWAQSDRAYQGINIGLRSPSGQLVELQVHTKASFDAKMSKFMHGTYEKQRVLLKGDPMIAEYEKQMHDYMKRVAVPRGASKIT